MAKRTLYYETNDHLAPVIKYLEEKDVLQPTVWISKNPNCTIDVHSFDYPQRGTFEYYNTPVEVIEKLEKYKETFMDMFQRNFRPWEQDAYKEFTLHEMSNMFYLLINKFYKLIKENNIEFVYLSRVPHLGADYLMFRVAEVLNIPRITFCCNYLIENTTKYTEYVSNLDDYGYFNDLEVDEEVLNSDFDKTKIFEILNKYQKLMKLEVEGIDAVDIKKTLWNELKNKDTRPYSLIRHQRRTDYIKNYNSAIEHNPDLNQKFVYFPLHLQPEMTTSLLGGKYVDQVLAIECLSKLLPEDIKIYVKENPAQSYFQRGDFFFERLLSIPNVTFVSKNVSTIDLMKKSIFVSTITGTAGWETILIGKPVVVFGQAWYLNFPGVFKYSKDLNINDVINTQVKLDDVIEQAKVHRAKMAQFCYDVYTTRRPMDDPENLQRIASFLEKHISKF